PFYLGSAFASNPSEAIAYYRAALALRPNAAMVHNNLAMLLTDTGQQDEAFDHFEAAARLTDYPSAPRTLAQPPPPPPRNHGMALKEGGPPDGAIPQSEQALRLDRKMPAGHVNLADAMAEMG